MPEGPSAATTASSTSWSVGTPSSSTTLPSQGLFTWSVPAPVRHWPATKKGFVAINASPPCFGPIRRRPRQSIAAITCLMFV